MPRSSTLVRKRDLIVRSANEDEREFLIGNRDEFRTRPFIYPLIEKGFGETFVALLNGRIVGYCQTLKYSKDAVEIERFSVRKGLERRGIGRILMGRIKGYYIKNNFKISSGQTHKETEPFYKRVGYETKPKGVDKTLFSAALNGNPKKAMALKTVRA